MHVWLAVVAAVLALSAAEIATAQDRDTTASPEFPRPRRAATAPT